MGEILETSYEGAAAWKGTDMAADPSEWTFVLDAEHVRELKSAVAAVMARGTPLLNATVADFPLPTLGPRIATLAAELEGGRGFELWRGLPVDEWSIDERAAAFWGMGLHLGQPIVQNAAGELLGSVINTTSADPTTNANSRFYHTDRAAPFHVDGADVVGLMCVRGAMEGGASLLVSSMSIYNEIARTRPDLLPLMYEPLWFDHRGERNAVTGKPYWVTSIAGWTGQKLSLMYLRSFIESGQRYDGAPPLTAAHAELFDLIDRLADSPALRLAMSFAPGDVQWLNNHTTLHSRTSFKDWPETDRRRWLLRLWLNFPKASRDRFTEGYGFYGIAVD